jgi:L-histidine Nalpha-methyltransferase
VQPLADEYSPALDRLEAAAVGPKLVLFLGSTIGNFSRSEAVSFLKGLRASLAPGDGLLIGFDLSKEPAKILKAYDDANGVTARFNLNLLARINRELQGDFRLGEFLHHAVYDPEERVARSYLVSVRRQTVRLGRTGLSFTFEPWESIHTENSFKFQPEETFGIAQAAGFRETAVFQDSAGYFQDVFWARTS